MEDVRSVPHCEVKVFFIHTTSIKENRIYEGVLAYYQDAAHNTLFIKYHDGDRYRIITHALDLVYGYDPENEHVSNRKLTIQEFMGA